jgi:threonine/homoserine/homoserine lactone efflux protein
MYILTRSVSQGRRAGILSALGIGSGVLVHTAFAASGLSVILRTSAWAFAIVKWAGAAYLMFLGIKALVNRGETLAAPDVSPMSVGRIYRQGVLTNVLNPKVAVFFLAFLPQFVDPLAGSGPIPFLVLGGLFVFGGTLWCLVVAVSAATATRAIRENARWVRWLERVAGCVYIALRLNLLRSKPQPA